MIPRAAPGRRFAPLAVSLQLVASERLPQQGPKKRADRVGVPPAIELRDAVEALGRLSVERERDPPRTASLVGAGGHERARFLRGLWRSRYALTRRA